MTGGTGVMLLIVERINKARSGGHGHRVTAGTFAVQRQVAGGRMIDIMIGPVAAGVTGGTGVRTDFMADGAADQGVGARVMTGGTAVMDLVVARIGEGCRRVIVTDQTGRFTSDVLRGNVINTVINIRHLRRVTGGAGHTGTGGDGGLNRQLRRGAVAVIDVGVTA